MGKSKDNILDYIPAELLEGFYNISYRCGYNDFTGMFSLFISDLQRENKKENETTLDSFKEFCIRYKEVKAQKSDRIKDFIKVSKMIEDKFKEIDLLIYDAAVIDVKIYELIGLTPELYNSYLPPSSIELTKKARIVKDINHLKSGVNSYIYNIDCQPKEVESLYFVKNFDTTKEALEYMKIKVIDGFMVKETDKLIEDIVHRGVAKTTSPFMAYYLYYKFPLIFDDDIILF